MWLGGLLLLLLILIFAALISRIKLTLNVNKLGKDDTILIEVSALFGLFKYHYEIPMLKFKNLKQGLQVKEKKEANVKQDEQKEDQTNIGKDKIDYWIDNWKSMLAATHDLKLWLNRTLREVKVRHLDWTTELGLSDAVHTAQLTGALYGVKYSLVGMLSYQLRLLVPPKLFVIPIYGNQPHFSTKMTCIAEIRCGYAIYAGLVLIVRVLKVKGGAKKWQNILFKG
ncbi:DUF2953 domain-containing protein [Paenibacillus sp. YPG26]|uniref:DUF2953 domain-containing protein n=1 Tax=Paenibacillus sp. YPG26 TaxID=2878915 RepID=UPI00203E89D2|nr:DUF2953 domain-containing protein [Paenibacillus sp. YPG26]USB35042.1 DUF2953 domain-containing protein [Paenibacillus sp. YPG26]